jgi:putative nucleotidyltransferase-like protein
VNYERQPTLLQRLLRHAAQQRDVGLRWEAVDDLEIEHTVKAGFAPLLWRVAVDSGAPPPASWRDTLQAADLVAQVSHGNACDATMAIVDACHAGGAQVTLLKGVSIGEHYPAAHLRPMGDVDLLVAQRDREWVESTMVRGGYVRMAGFEEKEGDAHGTPLFKPDLGVWVEIHTGLFPERDRLRTNRLFAPAELDRHTVPSTFHDRRVGRFRDELQLIYIASYWIRDLSKEGLHASFVRPLFDAVYLLRARTAKLDWDGMVANLDNELAAASLYALLRYLSTRGYSDVPEGVLLALEQRQSLVGPVEHAVLGALVDACLVGTRPGLAAWAERHPMVGSSVLQRLFDGGSAVGKMLLLPWAVLFPPQVAERYTWQYQRERWRRFLGRVS